MKKTPPPSPPPPSSPWQPVRELLTPEVIGFVLLAIGGLALASILRAAPGSPAWLSQVFGWGAPIIALGLIVTGGLALASRTLRVRIRWPMLVGAELLFVGLLALTHLWWSGEDPLTQARMGGGGGYLGWGVSTLLRDTLGEGVSALLLLTLIAIGLWLIVRPVWQLAAYYLLEGWDRVRGVDWQRLDPTSDVTPPPPPAATQAPPAARSAAKTTRASPASPAAPRAVPAGENKAAAPPPASAAPQAAARKPRTATGAATAAAVTQVAGDTPPVVRNPALPSMTLLATEGSQRFGEATVREMANTIERTLAAFNVPAKVISVNRGPTVTQFGVEPGYLDRGGERVKVRVSKIERLSDDLALALAAPSIRIEAPVPGRPYVGIEVPNPQSTLVALRAVLQSPQFQKLDSPLAIALGKDVSGTPVTYDLGKMPHLLIAGATGSGKSVCINAVVTSLLMNNTAQTLRLLMADPKMVELPIYNGIPHLLGSVVVDVEEAVGMLTWATLQMDDRYRKFADVGARNLESYNKLAAKQGFEPLPYVVIVIDELADLMLNAPDQVERYICRLAQMARATGIHLVVATQRPSVDVVTGLIKANFPARIAFAVTSQIDSRVILDSPGAEKLLGRGDMLLMTADSAKLRRVQGCYVSEREIERVVDFWRKQVPAGARPVHQPWAGLLEQEAEDTEMEAAIEAIRGRKRVSTSLLQRQMRIGYPRAARLMELLEARGYVGPDEGGGRSRLVLFESEADGPLDEDL